MYQVFVNDELKHKTYSKKMFQKLLKKYADKGCEVWNNGYNLAFVKGE